MSKKHLLLVSVILFGFILRIYMISTIPPGVNRDEAAIGYNAYSIIKTIRDEYGELLPLSFRSFGDWKLPLYIYSSIIPISFLGLNELSVRLISVFAGITTILLTYLITVNFFFDDEMRQKIGLLASFFAAVSPWSIHFSRVASEANLAVLLNCIGIYLFFTVKNNAKTIFLSAFFLALSLYSYHGSHVFIPLLITGLFFILFKRYEGTGKKLIFIVPLLIMGLIIYSKTLVLADKTKISGLSPLSNDYTVYDQINGERHEHINTIVAKLIHNKTRLLFDTYAHGYLMSFSPEFLFFQGGANKQHNIPGTGNLYPYQSILIIVGIYYILIRRNSKKIFLLYWLAISPIAAAITKDAPHSARMLAVIPVFDILTASGLICLLRLFKGKFNKIAILISILIVTVYAGFYFDNYFVHFPIKSSADWGFIYKDLVMKIEKDLPSYNEIKIDHPEFSPYIYYLFYTKYDPSKYQKNVLRYPVDKEGYIHVHKLDKLTFKKIDWSDDMIKPDTLLVSWVQNTPFGATDSSVLVNNEVLGRLQRMNGTTYGLNLNDIIRNRLIDSVELKDKSKQFYLIDINK